MAKKALCIGINDYPGTRSDLTGCVNDAHDWAGILEARQFEVRKLLDAQATKAEMKRAIGGLIAGAEPDDTLIITYSGHGTWVPDTSGDEADGRDEGLCPHDIRTAGALLDDEIHALFNQRRERVRILLAVGQLPLRIGDTGRRQRPGRGGAAGPVSAPGGLDDGRPAAAGNPEAQCALRGACPGRRRPAPVRLHGYRIQLGHPIPRSSQRRLHLLRHQDPEDVCRRMRPTSSGTGRSGITCPRPGCPRTPRSWGRPRRVVSGFSSDPNTPGP